MPRRAANKKPRIKTSLFAAEQISNLILNDKMSPYSVSMVLKEKIKNKYVSSPRTIYSLIDAGFLRQNMAARHIIPGRKRNLGLYRIRPKPCPGGTALPDGQKRPTAGHVLDIWKWIPSFLRARARAEYSAPMTANRAGTVLRSLMLYLKPKSSAL